MGGKRSDHESNSAEARARALATGEYGQALLKHVAALAVPFLIIRRGKFSRANPSQNKGLFTNGTAFFIDFGNGPFGVTANHVVEEALAETTVSLGLFPKQYRQPAQALVEFNDLRQRIIWQSPSHDVATFRIGDEEIQHLGVSILTARPIIPEEGRGGIAFVGFPGAQREIVGIGGSQIQPEMTFSFAVFPGFGIASSVSSRQITFQFEPEALVQTPGFSAPPPDFDLGGMSGGPLLARVETVAGIEHWALAGIITDGKMLPEHESGFLFAARADYLMPDGKINEQAV
jgi:hypothetical protein